jgi:hypothetical protein
VEVLTAARPQEILLFSDARRPGPGDGESMPQARVPKKTVSKRNNRGLEAPMIITPAALLRLVRTILGREAQR